MEGQPEAAARNATALRGETVKQLKYARPPKHLKQVKHPR
jgi:hypothetical protein